MRNYIHDRGVLPQKSRNFKNIKISEFQNPRNLWILKISELKKFAKSRNFKIRKYLNGFRAANSWFTPSGLLGGLFPEELSTHSQLHATPRRPHAPAGLVLVNWLSDFVQYLGEYYIETRGDPGKLLGKGSFRPLIGVFYDSLDRFHRIF